MTGTAAQTVNANTCQEDKDTAPSLDDILTSLSKNKKEWATLGIEAKIKLLKEVLSRFPHYVELLGLEGSKIRGLADSPPDMAYESLLSCLVPVKYLSKLLDTLEGIAARRACPRLEQRTLSNGQTAVKVWPVTISDKWHPLLPSATAEVILKPKVSVPTLDSESSPKSTGAGHDEQDVQGAFYLNPDPNFEGGVCAILAPGNHGFLGLKDVFVALFERGEVVALKPHPQMRPWHRIADRILEPFSEAGFYASVPCATVEETLQLLHHPRVDCVHMTGGTATHDAIVWGASAEERAARRAANDPLLKKPISSELGCVTPWLVVGGAKWTSTEIETQAWNVATAAAFNCSCNCNAAKVVIVQGDWPQADAFVAAVRRCLWDFPTPPPYYPGIHDRFREFHRRYPDAEVIEPPPQPSSRDGFGPALPYLLQVLDRVPERPGDEYAFRVEPFAPVLTVVKLDPTTDPYAERDRAAFTAATSTSAASATVPAFLSAAVRLANEEIWGTLTCSLLVHASVETAPATSANVERAILDLRYGLVAVNAWSGMAIPLGVLPWGAFSGAQTLADIGSGTGPAANPYLVPRVQKSLYRVPLSGRAHRGPPHKQPFPMALAKAVVGFACGGVVGAAAAFVQQKTLEHIEEEERKRKAAAPAAGMGSN